MKRLFIALYGEKKLRQHINHAILSFHYVDYKTREEMVDRAMELILGEMTTDDVSDIIGI